MKRIRDYEPKQTPDIDILSDVVYHTHSKLWWLEGWLQENLTEEQKEKLARDYERGMN